MPLYEYRCDGCEHQFEIQQKLADAPLKKCPECGKQKLAKVISATLFQLKGGGWYKDLYSSPKSGSPESGSKLSGDEKIEKALKKSDAAEKTESKTETKTESTTSDVKKKSKAA